MYKFKTEIGDFDFPSNYDELTVEDLFFIRENIDNYALILERLTGLNSVQLAVIDLTQLDPFFEFMSQPLHEIEHADFVGDFDLSFDFKEKTFGQKVKASQHVKDNEPLEALAVYCKCDKKVFMSMSVNAVFGAVNYVVSKLSEMDKERHKMLNFTPTKEQEMAGISKFDELGEFNTIDTIAQKYNYTHAQVEELEYNLVILILYRSKIQTNFENKLREIVTK